MIGLILFQKITLLLVASSNLMLAFFVIRRDKKNKINIWFFLFGVSLALWSFGMMQYATIDISNVNSILAWSKFLYFWGLCVSLSFFCFSLFFVYEEMKVMYVIYSSLPVVLNIYLIFFSRTVIRGFYFEPGNRILELGAMSFLYYLVFFVFMGGGFVVLFLEYLKSRYERRMQLVYMIIGTFVPFLYASVVNMIMPIFNNYILAWTGPLALFVTITFIGYSIIAHKLMDIKLVMRNYTVYAMSLVSISAPALLIRYAASGFLGEYLFFLDVLIFILGVSFFSNIKTHFYHFANKYFFSSLYDPQVVISEISNELRSSLKTKEIYRIIYEALQQAMHFESFAIVGYEKRKHNHDVVYCKNCGEDEIGMIVNNKDFLAKLSESDSPITGESLGIIMLGKHDKYKKKMSMSIFIPLRFKNAYIGAMCLGPKISGDIYNNDDQNLFKIISFQAAVALENANLYEEVIKQKEKLSVQGRKLKDFNSHLQEKVDEQTKDIREKNEYLQKLLEMRSEFLDIASHQLRTPVSVIKGTLSMLIKGEIKDKAKQQMFLDNCFQKSLKLSEIIHDILKASEMDTDQKFDLRMTKVNVCDLVNAIANDKKMEIEGRGLEFKIDLPKACINIWGEESYLKQAIVNLVNNSIQYTLQGSISISANREGKHMAIRVSDTGIGIPEKDRDKLFQKFSRAQNAVNTYTDGSGLGLFIIKKIIDAHKGASVEIESSEIGKGTVFLIKLLIA